MTGSLLASTAVLVVARHHARIGIGLLALIVVAVVAYVLYRGTERRRSRRSHGNDEREGRPGGAPPLTVAPPGGEPGGALPNDPGGDRQGPLRPAPVHEGAGSLPVRPSVSRAGSNGEWAVETHGLTKRFGANVAVDDVELLVPRGSAFGYLGPNGAGKTTLIRTLLGLTKADKGTMSLLGVPVPKERSRALSRVGAIVDEPRFHGHLTGRENLRILAAARGPGADGRITPSLERVGLAGRADDRVVSYSMGMRQRLGVAACLLGDPELLMLDEPMNGLDPAGMHDMRTMIRSFVEEGRTVVLSSHLLDEVERTCDAVAIVDRGKVIRQGPIETLVRGAAVVVEVECSEPASAAGVVEAAQIGSRVAVTERGLNVTMPAGTSREVVAELNRLLVSAGVSVYGLREMRTSLEDWFLSVTSRLGER